MITKKNTAHLLWCQLRHLDKRVAKNVVATETELNGQIVGATAIDNIRFFVLLSLKTASEIIAFVVEVQN